MLSDLLLNTVLIIDEKFARRSRNDPVRKLSLFKGVKNGCRPTLGHVSYTRPLNGNHLGGAIGG